MTSLYGGAELGGTKCILAVANNPLDIIVRTEIPTGNPLLIIFEKNLEVKKYKYLDSKRAKNILFNV